MIDFKNDCWFENWPSTGGREGGVHKGQGGWEDKKRGLARPLQVGRWQFCQTTELTRLVLSPQMSRSPHHPPVF